jgi:hypothetical protein
VSQKGPLHHEVIMILRSPTENENGEVSLHRQCKEFRHSRMLLAGIQGHGLDPRLKHSGVTNWESFSFNLQFSMEIVQNPAWQSRNQKKNGFYHEAHEEHEARGFY